MVNITILVNIIVESIVVCFFRKCNFCSKVKLKIQNLQEPFPIIQLQDKLQKLLNSILSISYWPSKNWISQDNTHITIYLFKNFLSNSDAYLKWFTGTFFFSFCINTVLKNTTKSKLKFLGFLLLLLLLLFIMNLLFPVSYSYIS